MTGARLWEVAAQAKGTGTIKMFLFCVVIAV
jgi:hypothetical protein